MDRGTRTAVVAAALVGGSILFAALAVVGAAGAIAFVISKRLPGAVDETVGGPVAIVREAEALSDEEAARLAAAHPVLEPGSPFVVARLERSEGPLPPRFAATPVKPPAPFFYDDPARPPRDHVADAICLGDPAMRRWIVDALVGADDAESPDDDPFYDDGYQSLLSTCRRKETCEWAARTALTVEPPGARRWLWTLAATCLHPGSEALVAGAPADVVYDHRWALWLNDRKVLWDPKLARVLKDELAGDPGARDDGEVGRIVEIMACTRDPGADAAIREALAAAPDEAARRAIAVAAAASLDPDLVKARREACAEPSLAERCASAQEDVEWRFPPPLPPARLLEAVRADDLDVARYLEANPTHRAATIAALERCETSEDEVDTCLAALAAVDWAAARRQAKKLARSPVLRDPDGGWNAYEPLSELLAALQRFESQAALDSYLDELGLLADVPPERPELAGAFLPGTVRARLASRGRGYLYDGEEVGQAIAHPVRRLAALAPALDGWVFESTRTDRRADDLWLQELRAYRDGQVRTLSFLGRRDSADFAVVAGFPNALLAEAGAEDRVLDLSVDELGLAVVGPEASFRRLVAEGLLVVPHGEVEEPEED